MASANWGNCVRVRKFSETEMTKMKHSQEKLSHVIWIGGPTDSGKTTIAKQIAEIKGYQYYSYDQTGAEHLQKLAQINTKHKKYIKSVLTEHWAGYTALEIAEQSLEIAKERFQFVIEDVQVLPNHIPVIAEGAGFMPEIVRPVMTNRFQGIWLLPTEEVMKTSFGKKARFLRSRMGEQAEEIIQTLLQANIHLMEAVKSQAEQYNYKVYQIVGSRSVVENVTSVWEHLSQYMNK